MGLWSIILPETAAVTNLVTNPSAETATTGYTAAGGSLAASTASARRGYRSIAVTPTAGNTDGAYYGTVSLTNGQAYTASVDVRGAAGVPYRLYFATTAGVVKGTPATFTGTGAWQRITVTWTADASAAHRVYVVKDSHASTAVFYLDGLQVINLAYDVSYIDGGQEDCKWAGTPHASTSYREAGSRAGGRLVNLDAYEFYLSEFPGAGMADVEALMTPLALLPGMQDEGERIRERRFDLIGTLNGSTLPAFHANRQGLIDAVKSDRVKNKQMFTLAYSGAGKTLYAKARYLGGLTYARQEGFTERIALRCVSPDPFWYEDGESAAVLTTAQSIANANYAVKRVGGAWSNISSSFNAGVRDFVRGDDGMIYIGGIFANVGDANGDGIIRYDPVTGAISSLGTGGMPGGGGAEVVVKAPNGDILIGGTFIGVGGVANTQGAARWNGSAWQSISAGIAAYVLCLVFDSLGNLYITGVFNNIYKWDGSSLTTFATTNGQVNRLVIAPDDTMYACGTFTTIGGTTVSKVAYYNGSAWVDVGGGTTGTAEYIARAENGLVYLCGTFSSVGGVSASNLAVWNGSSWAALGNPNARTSRVFPVGGLLYASGQFTSVGGVTARRFAVYNGATWGPAEITAPGSPVINGLMVEGDDIYLGYDTAGTATASALTTVTNPGTTQAYPKITIKRSGGTSATVAYLKNETTGATLYLDYPLQNGEELTLDFSLGKRAVTSSYYGNVIGRALLRNSDFSSFCLLPGENRLTVYVVEVGSPTMTAYLTQSIPHWSIDGGA